MEDEMDLNQTEGPDNPGNTETSIGLLFAKQGLNQMCNFIPFSDLKKIRLVCRLWNDVCSNHNRFYSANGVLKPGWEQKCETLAVASMVTWKSLTLRCFSIQCNKIFPVYWASTAPHIKTLNLSGLRGSCTQVCDLIIKCPMLQEINFHKVAFTTVEILPTKAGPNPENHPQIPNHDQQGSIKRTLICCQDQTYTPKPKDFVNPTIKSISIAHQSSFPLCLMDLLIQRSAGKLENFTFEKNKSVIQSTLEHHPNINTLEQYLIRLCQINVENLKSFVWVNSGNDTLLFKLLSQDFHPTALQTLIVGDGQFQNLWEHRNHRHRPSTFWPPMVTFLRGNYGVTDLTISTNVTLQVTDDLQAILTLMTTLRKFKLEVLSTLRHEVEINIFGGSRELEVLEIVDKDPEKARRHRGSISNSYMNGLPLSIRHLNTDHMIQAGVFGNAVIHPAYMLLTSLCIYRGDNIGNVQIQLIIIHLTQLQKLTIWHASKINDTGLTGLDQVACRQIFHCHSQGLLLKEPIQTPGVVRHTLAELTLLRKLDLTGSWISDISLCFALRLPELRKLTLNACDRVSDIGLISLGTNNPKLKTLHIDKNRRISHYGLNRLIESSKSICTIKTTHILATRLGQSGVKEYTENPHFKDVVKIIPSCQRKDLKQHHRHLWWQNRF